MRPADFLTITGTEAFRLGYYRDCLTGVRDSRGLWWLVHWRSRTRWRWWR